MTISLVPPGGSSLLTPPDDLARFFSPSRAGGLVHEARKAILASFDLGGMAR